MTSSATGAHQIRVRVCIYRGVGDGQSRVSHPADRESQQGPPAGAFVVAVAASALRAAMMSNGGASRPGTRVLLAGW